jgi:hypothetical protein
MVDTTILEWSYSPAGYFEEPVALTREKYQATIQNGKIEVKLDHKTYESNPGIEADIEKSLNLRFLGAQLSTHKTYQLSFSSRQSIHPDGRKDVVITPGPAEVICLGCTVDIVVKSADGSTIRDSRKERIKAVEELADLVEKYGSDALAQSLLQSNKLAVDESSIELVHLYEIRDALTKKFGGENLACSTLGLSKSDWKKLGRIANDEPLKQGRHRGLHFGALREANEIELREAREIARHFTIAYLRHLEK